MTFKKNIISHQYEELFQLSHKNAWLLWFCQLINIVSLSAEISTWMLAILALCLCWQALLNKHIDTGKQVKVSPVLLKFFSVSGCIAIALTAKANGILISMVHLLAFAYLLKAFEIKQRKDFYQLSLLGLFLLASSFIFKQNLAFSIAIFLALILNLLVLLQEFSPKRKLFASVKTIVMLLMQSSILAIVLFIIFPRLTPFWQVPNAQSAQTGLSDEVSPGDIANLALSSELAFRVDFKGGNIPHYSDLYWRAMTLENYDGKKWTRVKAKSRYENTPTLLEKPFVPNISGKGMAYDVIVEPSYQSWLFGLSVATSNDPKIRLMSDYTIQSRAVLGQVSHYQLNSYLTAPLDLSISEVNKQRNLAIIKGSNPRLEELAVSLINAFSDPIERSNAILSLFRNQQYFYTLNPPLLANNSLDQFFFDTKAGFCVHYATTYTYLMRAAGVPARVVTGYLGGEYNGINSSKSEQQGGHLSIYQYDAHAWAEIWLDGVGWQRVDPTAAVDPQRVNNGWSTALLNQQSLLSNDLLGLYQFKNIAWLNKVRLQFDALDYQWTRWVLGYSNKQQYNLLKRFFGGNMHWKVAASIILVIIIVVIIIFIFNYFNANLFIRKKLPLSIKLYQQILKKLAEKGTIKPDDMTPTDFAKLVTQVHPTMSKNFLEFTKIFEYLIYQKTSTSNHEKHIIKLKNQYLILKNEIANN